MNCCRFSILANKSLYHTHIALHYITLYVLIFYDLISYHIGLKLQYINLISRPRWIGLLAASAQRPDGPSDAASTAPSVTADSLAPSILSGKKMPSKHSHPVISAATGLVI